MVHLGGRPSPPSLSCVHPMSASAAWGPTIPPVAVSALSGKAWKFGPERASRSCSQSSSRSRIAIMAGWVQLSRRCRRPSSRPSPVSRSKQEGQVSRFSPHARRNFAIPESSPSRFAASPRHDIDAVFLPKSARACASLVRPGMRLRAYIVAFMCTSPLSAARAMLPCTGAPRTHAAIWVATLALVCCLMSSSMRRPSHENTVYDPMPLRWGIATTSMRGLRGAAACAARSTSPLALHSSVLRLASSQVRPCSWGT